MLLQAIMVAGEYRGDCQDYSSIVYQELVWRVIGFSEVSD
jgi:hypothetical protein